MVSLLDSTKTTAASEEKAYINYLIGRQYYWKELDTLAFKYYQNARAQITTGDTLIVSLATKLYRNIGNLNSYFGHSDSITIYAQKALTLAYTANCSLEKNLEVSLQDNLGDGLYKLGDIDGALNHLSKGTEICRTGDVSYFICGRIGVLHARALTDANRIAEAKLVIQEAEGFMLETPDLIDEDSLILADIADVKFLIADTEKDILSARQAAQQSYSLNNQYRPSSIQMGHSYNNLGRLALKRGEYARGKALLLLALNVYQANHAAIDYGTCYENLAEAALLTHDTTQAVTYLENAQLAYHGSSARGDLNKALDKHQLKDPILRQAELTYQRHRSHPEQVPFSKVLSEVIRVDSIMSMLQYGVRSEYSKRNSIRKLKSFYEGLIGFSLDKWSDTRDSAYLYLGMTSLERSKAQILRERQRRSFSDNRTKGSSENNLRYTFLSARNKVVNDIRTAINEQQRTKLLNELAHLELKARITEDSLYAQQDLPLPETRERPILQSLKGRLAPEVTVLDYFIGEKAIFVSKLSDRKLELVRLNTPSLAVAAVIDTFQRALKAPGSLLWEEDKNLRDSTQRQIARSGHQLFQQLLRPVLPPPDKYSSITIIHDGPTAYIPFEALLTQAIDPKKSGSFHQYPFLVHDYQVNYEFSTSVWQDRLDRNYAGGEKALIVSPKQREGGFFKPFASSDSIWLASLTTGSQEAEGLSDLLRSDWLTKNKVTSFGLSTDLTSYGIVHFTGHGIVFPQNIYQSGLVLDPGFTSGEVKVLRLPELALLPLKIEMLVLSACETGYGEISEGEGMISLSRGGAVAGAKSVVASLWLVSQQTKNDFFQQFYRELNKGEQRMQALQTVKKAFALSENDFSHPFHWASYTNTGASGAINSSFFR